MEKVIFLRSHSFQDGAWSVIQNTPRLFQSLFTLN